MLLVIDGNWLVTRAMFATRWKDSDGNWQTLQSRDGTDTGTVFSCIRSLTHYIKVWRPTHILFVFDHGKSSFRTAIRPEYKANRGNREMDNAPSLSAFQYFLALANIRFYSEQNVEGDDLIASASLWQDQLPILIVSGDHDLRQLVTDRCHVLKPKTGNTPSTEEKYFDLAGIKREYSMTPARLVDHYSLCGDAGDGIAPVKGCGWKTAVKILSGKTLDEAIATDPRLKGWERHIRENKRLIELDGKVATFPVKLDECLWNETSFNKEEVREYFKKYQMTTLLGQPLWG